MSLARLFALAFGIVYLLTGLLSFVRPLTDAGGGGLLVGSRTHLVGLFATNWFHNVAHLVVGVLALAAAGRHDTAVLAARILGIVLVGVFVAGIFTGNLFGVMPLNWPDNLLHLLSALLALGIGFSEVGERRVARSRPLAPSHR